MTTDGNLNTLFQCSGVQNYPPLDVDTSGHSGGVNLMTLLLDGNEKGRKIY